MAEQRRRHKERVRQPARVSSWAIALALVAVLAFMVPAPVSAAASLTLDPTSGFRGATVRALARGFPANCEISILWDEVEIKRASSGSDEFAIEFRVPGDAPVGRHTVSMTVVESTAAGCAPSTRDDATFTVVLAATPTPSPTPKPTPTPVPISPGFGESVSGFVAANPMPIVISTLVVLLGGAALFVVRRARMAAAAKRAAEPGAWRHRVQTRR